MPGQGGKEVTQRARETGLVSPDMAGPALAFLVQHGGGGGGGAGSMIWTPHLPAQRAEHHSPGSEGGRRMEGAGEGVSNKGLTPF